MPTIVCIVFVKSHDQKIKKCPEEHFFIILTLVSFEDILLNQN